MCHTEQFCETRHSTSHCRAVTPPSQLLHAACILLLPGLKPAAGDDGLVCRSLFMMGGLLSICKICSEISTPLHCCALSMLSLGLSMVGLSVGRHSLSKILYRQPSQCSDTTFAHCGPAIGGIPMVAQDDGGVLRPQVGSVEAEDASARWLSNSLFHPCHVIVQLDWSIIVTLENATGATFLVCCALNGPWVQALMRQMSQCTNLAFWTCG